MIPGAGVVVAAGRGTRLGGRTKQLRLLDGRPVAAWAARALLEALAGPVVVVLPVDELERAGSDLRAALDPWWERIRLAPGGDRRRDSVVAGLDALDVREAAMVLVHDAARPFAERGLVERVARHAAAGRVVVPALPISDTLKEIDGERIVTTHDRRRFVAAQTPQGFPLDVLREAHAADAGDATDDAVLCERLGVPVTWIAGDRLNRKITEPDDWEWARRQVAEGRVRWR